MDVYELELNINDKEIKNEAYKNIPGNVERRYGR